MADFDILAAVKTGLGLHGNNHFDDTLQMYIDEVRDYLKKAGAKDSVINARSSAGVITRGVADLWNYGSGNAQLSPYFMERAIQLALEGENVQTDGNK